jgi:hypothetical protein
LCSSSIYFSPNFHHHLLFLCSVYWLLVASFLSILNLIC